MVGREPRSGATEFQPETHWSVEGNTLTLHARAATPDGEMKSISMSLVDTQERAMVNIPVLTATDLLLKLKEACK